MGLKGYAYGTLGFFFQSVGLCIIKHIFLLIPFAMSSDITFWRHVFLSFICILSMGFQLSPIFKTKIEQENVNISRFEDEDNDEVIQSPRQQRECYYNLLLIGLLFTLSTMFFTSSTSYISVTKVQVIFGMKAFFVLIMSIGILKMKFSYLELAGICMSFCGLLIFSMPNGQTELENQDKSIIVFDFLNINWHSATKTNSFSEDNEDSNFVNDLKGIIICLIGAACSGMATVLTKKIQNLQNGKIEEDKILLSNCLHISIFCNMFGTVELSLQSSPWTSYTSEMMWFFIFIFVLSLTSYISMKYVLRTISIETPSMVSIYEFQGVVFTAALDSLILGTTFTFKDLFAGCLILFPNIVISCIKYCSSNKEDPRIGKIDSKE